MERSASGRKVFGKVSGAGYRKDRDENEEGIGGEAGAATVGDDKSYFHSRR